ncbi:MAG: hypothetical protein V4469_04440 [Patescibacteria group bacterium]
MKKLDFNEVPKDLKPHPLFEGFSDKLKDPKVFLKTEKKLLAILKIDHKHKTVTQYVKCPECAAKREERKRIMEELGFKSINQYLEWKKIMTIIINQKNFQIR